jgi:uncharacterized membrane protein
MMFPIFLSVVNWIHLFATVVWIGGMTTNLFVVLPSIRETLEPGVMGKLMGAVMKRFRVWIYISIVLLVLTGFGMMRFNMNYLGFAQFGNVWSVVSPSKEADITCSNRVYSGPDRASAHRYYGGNFGYILI